MKQIRFIVEPSKNTFSGYHVVIKWTNDGFGWRSASFTKWEAVIKFLAINETDDFSFIVHSEVL